MEQEDLDRLEGLHTRLQHMQTQRGQGPDGETTPVAEEEEEAFDYTPVQSCEEEISEDSPSVSHQGSDHPSDDSEVSRSVNGRRSDRQSLILTYCKGLETSDRSVLSGQSDLDFDYYEHIRRT